MHITIDSMVHLLKSELSNQDLYLLKRRLIVVPKKTDYDRMPEAITLYKESEKYISIPREYFFNTVTMEHDIEYKYSLGHSLRDLQKIKLRRDQIPLVLEVMKHYKKGPSLAGILCAGTGVGKTICSLDVARRLDMTSIIKVYKGNLADQWENEIKKFYPNAKIGRIQGDILDYEGCDFVIAMIQTLASRREYFLSLPKLRNYFGLEIVDEARKTGAKEWSTTADIFNCKHRLALDATPYRKDGCENVFKYHLGDVIVRADGTRLNPRVFIKESGFKCYSDYSINNQHTTRQLLRLSKDDKRNRMLATEVVKAASNGRNVILMSKFVEHLQTLKELIQAKIHLSNDEKLNKKSVGMYVGALYTGETKSSGKGRKKVKLKKTQNKEELIRAKESDIILATYKMAEDAFDVPRLDVLFMALPISDPIQAIGRILREKQGKKDPIVVDINDRYVNFCNALMKKRSKIYSEKGWSYSHVR